MLFWLSRKTIMASKEDNVQKFELWEATQTDDSYRQMIHGSNLNRSDIAKGSGIGKSALRQNPEVKRLLNKLELTLRSRKILPDLTPKAVSDNKQIKEYDHKKTDRLIDQNKSSKLEQENIELKAKIKELEKKIEDSERLGEVSEVLNDMGMIPR